MRVVASPPTTSAWPLPTNTLSEPSLWATVLTLEVLRQLIDQVIALVEQAVRRLAGAVVLRRHDLLVETGDMFCASEVMVLASD